MWLKSTSTACFSAIKHDKGDPVTGSPKIATPGYTSSVKARRMSEAVFWMKASDSASVTLSPQ